MIKTTREVLVDKGLITMKPASFFFLRHINGGIFPGNCVTWCDPIEPHAGYPPKLYKTRQGAEYAAKLWAKGCIDRNGKIHKPDRPRDINDIIIQEIQL